MKSALELGRWTFLAPVGYVNVPRTYGKSLIPDPERASVVQQIFRDFATGRFTKQALLDEMTRRGLKMRKGLPVSAQAFITMLQNKLYVGIVEASGYGVVGKRGDFNPLIPDDVFYRVQAILAGRMGGRRATRLQRRVDEAAVDAVAINDHPGNPRSVWIALSSRNSAIDFNHLTGHYPRLGHAALLHTQFGVTGE